MPNGFDEALATAPTSNGFDQVEAEKKFSAPAGNGFDQIEAEKQKAPQLDYGPTPEQRAGYQAQHPLLGRMFNAAASLTGQSTESPLAQAAARFAGAAPQDRSAVGNAAAAALQNVGHPFAQVGQAAGLVPAGPQGPQPFQYNPNTVSGQVGGAAGMIGAGLAAGPAAAPVFAVSGFKGAQQQVAAQRAQGAQISPVHEGLFEVSKTVQGVLQALPLGNAAGALESRLTPYLGELIGKYGPKVVAAGLAQAGVNDAANMVERATVNPQRGFNEGGLQAGLFGAGFEAVHGAAGVQEPAQPTIQEPQARPEPSPTPDRPAGSQPQQTLHLDMAAIRAKLEATNPAERHPGTDAQVDQMHRERIAAEEAKPRDQEPTPEEAAAQERQKLTDLAGPDARIVEAPQVVKKNLLEKLLAARGTEDQGRVNATEPNPGRRESDLPEHTIEPYTEPAESLKSKLTPNETIRGHAEDYAKQAGIDHAPDREYTPVDTDRAQRIADSYDASKHSPNDPKVKASYDALKSETLAQFNYLKDQGVKIEPWTGEGQPYANSKAMAADAAKGHLYVYPGGNMPADHPLAEQAGDTGMTYNTLFRGVHDYFGHAQEGNGFGPKGEEHAWKQHAAMYSDAAKPAMTAETRGQNSWVNFGPHGEANQANPAKTIYAEQKATVLPDEFNGTEPAKRGLNRRGSVAIPGVLGKAVDAVRDAVTESPEARKASLSIRESRGSAENDAHKLEAKIAPAREHVPSFSSNPGAALQYADQIEAGHPDGGIPATSDAVGAIADFRKDNAERARKLGINHLDEDGQGLVRLFDFPSDNGHDGDRSLAGTNNPFRSQKYDTFSEAYNAATRAGGKPKFDNVLDMQAARQYEIGKNLSMRENMRAAEKAGTAEWVKDGAKPGNADAVPIEDRIIGSETRKMSLPSWMAVKLGTLNHYDGEQFLRENDNRIVPIVPGESAQAGYSPVAHEAHGSFRMAPDIAEKYNNFSRMDTSNDSVATAAQKIARTATAFRYDANMSHAALGSVSGLFRHLTNAIERAGHGEFGPALNSLGDALTGGQVSGSKFRRSLEAGTAGDEGERAMAVEPALRLRKITDEPRHTFSQAFSDLKDGKVGSAMWDVFKATHNFTFNEVLPNVVASHAKAIAENQINRGVPSEAGRENMAREVDALSKQIGAHMRTPEFKENMTRRVAELLIPASKFWEGQVRNVASAATGNKAALAPLVVGAVATVVANTVIQMASTKLNTGTAVPPDSLEDMLHPRLGTKNESGNEARLTYPNPVVRVIDMIRHPLKQGEAVLNPLIPAAADLARNKDFAGNQVMPNDGSTGGNLLRAAGHLAKGALPMSVGALGSPQETQPKPLLEKLRDSAMGTVGSRISHPVTSDAQQEAYDQLNKSEPQGGRDLAEQDRHTSEAKWAKDLRSGRPFEEVRQEMLAKPWINESIAQSVVRRAQEPEGLGGLVTDSQFQPDGLLKIWDKATPAERAQMKPALEKRFTGVKSTSPDMDQNWKDLFKAVEGK